MPLFALQLVLRADGRDMSGSPFLRTKSVDEWIAFDYEKANDGDAVTFSDLPLGELSEVQVLIVRSDRRVTLRLNNQTDAGLVIEAGGMVILTDVDIDSASNRVRINNNSGAVALIRGWAGGT